MCKIDTLPDALVQFAEIDLETDGDPEIEADFETIFLWLHSSPFDVGHERTSSVHRMLGHGRILVEYEIIEDDKRMLIHQFSLLPTP